MKNRFVWVGALALTMTVTPQVQTMALTNGVIVISTRRDQDLLLGGGEVLNQKGPGNTAPGDTAMAALLEDYGYVARVLPDSEIKDNWAAYAPTDPNFSVALLIASGSGASSVVPPAPISDPPIPVMMGEHSDLGSDLSKPGTILMYEGTQSNDPNESGVGNSANAATKYMKVIAPNHPIMQGIPLDAEGRVKIFRDKYPEENSHLPSGGTPKPNYEYRWCTQNVSNAAPGTIVLGVLAGTNSPADGKNGDDASRACFAVCDVGGILATNSTLGYAETNAARKVHLFANEDGNGGVRRVFCALTDLGRVIFVRACKWAMGETLQPYQPLGMITASLVGDQQVQLAWTGSSTKNYKILGTDNLFAPRLLWHTVAQDIAGVDGTVTATLQISAGPQEAFFAVMPVP